MCFEFDFDEDVEVRFDENDYDASLPNFKGTITGLLDDVRLKLEKLLENSNSAKSLLMFYICKINTFQRIFKIFDLNPKGTPSDETIHVALSIYARELDAVLDQTVLTVASGLFSLSLASLRIALETIVYGVLFDVMIYRRFRDCASSYIDGLINKFRVNKGSISEYAFSIKELLDRLNVECQSDCEDSGAVLEVVSQLSDNERNSDRFPMRGFKLSFSYSVDLLHNCGVIEKNVGRNLKDLYRGLSGFIHRVNPGLTDVGIRLSSEKELNWIELEFDPDEVVGYLEKMSATIELIRKLIIYYERYLGYG